MGKGKINNAALSTALAFHYQVLIGLDKCFSLEENQAVWFEYDGDVSLISPNALESKQTEVKDYAEPLTDNHVNLWKTLKNWLSAEFDHTKYGVLVLHTTQAFGANTHLKDWNSKSGVQRLQVLEKIFSERSKAQLNSGKPSKVFNLQKEVLEDSSRKEMVRILDKIVLNVESDNMEAIIRKYHNKLSGYIPLANRQAFVEGLIGFIYAQASSTGWVIEKRDFDQIRESLVAKWGPTPFTIPDFAQREATEEEVEEYITALFAQKICEIEYDRVLSEAIGDWLEFINSTIEQLHGYPQYLKMVERYRDQWTRKFSAKYRIASRRNGDSIKISQDLYDQVTSETPFGTFGYPNPDLVFRNGLIHDAMDDEERNLKWRIEV